MQTSPGHLRQFVRTGGGDHGLLRGALQWPLLLPDLGASLAGGRGMGDPPGNTGSWAIFWVWKLEKTVNPSHFGLQGDSTS